MQGDELNCVPLFVEIQILSSSECDLIWKSGLVDVIRENEVTLISVGPDPI